MAGREDGGARWKQARALAGEVQTGVSRCEDGRGSKHDEGWKHSCLPSLSPTRCDVPCRDRPPGRLPGVVPVAVSRPTLPEREPLTGWVLLYTCLTDTSHACPPVKVDCLGFV
jgi:hypothetical protein